MINNNNNESTTFLCRTVRSLRQTTLSWSWPIPAQCSSTRSPPLKPEFSWISGGRCLVTCQSTWLRKSTHSCQVNDKEFIYSWRVVCVTIPDKQREKREKNTAEWQMKVMWRSEQSDRGARSRKPFRVLLVRRRCAPPRKLQSTELTFTVCSAIQLKYQSHSIKAATPVTLTQVQLECWSQAHWWIDKCTFRNQKKAFSFFSPVHVRSVHLWAFIHRAGSLTDLLHSPFLSFLQSI